MDSLELKSLLVLRRIKQRDLARYLGLSPSRLCDLLNAVRPIDSDVQRRIREAIETLKSQRETR